MSAHQAASIRKYRHLLMVTDQAQAGDIGHAQHPPSSASTPFEIEKGRTLLPVCLWCKPRLLAAPKRETRFSLAGRQIPDGSDIDHLPFELRLSERQVVPAPADGHDAATHLRHQNQLHRAVLEGLAGPSIVASGDDGDLCAHD